MIIDADPARLDEALEALPNTPAVFVIFVSNGDPYLARTALLRRRLKRLLASRERPSRFLNLRQAAARIEYFPVGSALESSLRLYQLARAHFPKTYLELLKLRMPAYVKITLGSRFPRSLVTTHVGGTGLYFGPFRSRASAERFDSQFLDLFQMRRCDADLEPSPDHPGCIYGEMGMCLRPCQLVVGEDEYGHEAARAAEFLSTRGRSMLDSAAAARDRLSQELEFEEAARQHKRIEKMQEVLKLRDDLVRDIARLNGVAVTGSAEPNAVELWFLREGWWQEPRRFSFEIAEANSISLDEKIRRTVAEMEWRRGTVKQRQEHLALLARWFYSSWRDGDWLEFRAPDDVPYRKLVRAISRAAAKS